MRKHLSLQIGVASMLALTVAVAAAGPAGRRFHSVRAEEFERAQPVCVGGEFSGTIGGEMVINGLPYRLATNAIVYQIGTGLIPLGTTVQDRSVTLSGLKMNNTTVIYSVSVRPAGEMTFETADMSDKVHIANPSIPK
jgi:hypothetical protein